MLLAAMVLWSWHADAQQLSRPRLKNLVRDTPVVILFLSTTCPICQKYAGMLPALQQQYPQVKFAGIFTKWETWTDVLQFKHAYGINFEVWLDKKNHLLRQLKASTTPEVFLLNENGNIMYQGAIDNWFYGLGKYRPQITEHYLINALEAFVQGKDIPIKKTKPIGCLIEQ